MDDAAWVHGLGYVASALVFSTFYMKTMVRLRAIAIASNVAFMAYGLAGAIYPVFILHAILLPVNCVRLCQLRGLARKVQAAARGDLPTDWLIPHMTRHTVPAGHVLFRKDDPGSAMYLILAGSVRIPELGVVVGPGAILGEMGVFGPDHRRTGSAICETDVEIGSLTDEQAVQLYYQNPAFGFHLFRLVVGRVLENERSRRGPDSAGGA